MSMKEKMNNINWNFKDKIVVVVGASRGIGKSTAEHFENAGAIVYRISTSNCDISKKSDIDNYIKN